jgi:hypothetical protein
MLIKWHGGEDTDSEFVATEYEEICQTLAFEKTVQKTDFKSMFATRPNTWGIGIDISVAGKMNDI